MFTEYDDLLLKDICGEQDLNATECIKVSQGVIELVRDLGAMVS